MGTALFIAIAWAVVASCAAHFQVLEINALKAMLKDAQENGANLRHEMTRIANVSERWTDSLVSQINEIARAALGEK